MKLKCPSCGGDHNLTEHFRLQREAKSTPVINAPVANAVANEKPCIANEASYVANAPKSNAERVRIWRKAHREEYNAKMREYRRSHGRSKAAV